MHTLIDQVGNCNHPQRKSPEDRVSVGRKPRRDDIPGKQHGHTNERKNAENDWCPPANAIETPVHKKSLKRPVQRLRQASASWRCTLVRSCYAPCNAEKIAR